MLKIAAVQMLVSENTNSNLNRIQKFMCQATKNKVDVICFPETCLVSNEKVLNPINMGVKKIAALAKQLKTAVIFGTYLKVDAKIKNQIIVINKNGVIIHRYNKKNAYISEKHFLNVGRKNKVFLIKKIPCAVINCWDYAYPEYVRSLAKQGAKVIFCPSYLLSHKKTKEVLKYIPQVRAFDTLSYFVMVDAYTPETFKRSKICHPLKELASINNKEGIIYAEIKIEKIKKLREYFQTLD